MRIANRQIPGAIARREAFTANSASAEVNPSYVYAGRLPEPWRTLLNRHNTAGQIAYVVLSYATPIAWVLVDGTHVIPDVKYSVTTSRHQSLVRSALAGNGIRTQADVLVTLAVPA